MEPQQLAIPDIGPLVDVTYAPELTLAERAAAFHAQNPQVFRAIAELALRLRARGVKRGSISMLFETLRYRALETHGDKYKLNNSFRAWYARRVMLLYPTRLAGFFETREGPHDPDYHERGAR